MLLNPLHHRLFDNAHLTVTPDYRILYRDPKGANREHSKLEAALAIKLHNQLMGVPHLSKLRPLPEYIRRHNELIGWDI